ncbi:MAG: serine hydrolase, partial [Pseudomonadota bacterium]|nr:serine hydrolase [Pseudomonadota bacterium]
MPTLPFSIGIVMTLSHRTLLLPLQNRQMRALCAVALAIVLLRAPHVEAEPDSPTSNYFPAAHWRTATPESQGIDSVKLIELFRQVRKKASPIHSLLIVRHGYAVLDAHFFPYDGLEPHDLASVTKSITATLIGVALDQRKLTGLNQPMLSVFDDRTVDGRDGKAQVTLGDLLAMRSGLACEKGQDEATLARLRASDDWIQ